MRNKISVTSAFAYCLLGAGHAGAATLNRQGEIEHIQSLEATDTATEIAVAAASSTTMAADPEFDGASGWQFAVTPYLWAPKISAEIDPVQDGSVDMETSFTDILSNLKFAFMGAFEARNERFVILGDIIYLHVGSEADGPAGFVETDVDLATFIGTAAAGYRVVDQGPLFVDLFAGGRVTSIDAELELTGPLQSVEEDRSKTSLAPVVGARFRVPLGERWGLATYGDLGGFGLTSDLTWQLMGTVQYDISNHWRVAAGYRHVAAKVERGGTEIQLTLSGPIIGLSYRF
jgi:opacity protein-like surface antigen